MANKFLFPYNSDIYGKSSNVFLFEYPFKARFGMHPAIYKSVQKTSHSPHFAACHPPQIMAGFFFAFFQVP